MRWSRRTDGTNRVDVIAAAMTVALASTPTSTPGHGRQGPGRQLTDRDHRVRPDRVERVDPRQPIGGDVLLQRQIPEHSEHLEAETRNEGYG